MKQFSYSFDMSVRDYECDLQGIVNNSVYQNYLEHARHEYFKTIGLDFAALTSSGIMLVVIRAELDYRWPLRSGDDFTVKLVMEKVSRLKFAFYQDIVRRPDDKLILNAKIVGTGLTEEGRPVIPEEIERAATPRRAG